MAKKSRKRTKRIKNLIVICTLSSMVFIVATFAWFIGMRTVNVSSFDVSIATTDSLLLSLDGKKWDTTVTINSTNFNDTTVVYEGNANTWSEGGLIPVSSIGEMNNVSSRMKLYEKASLTATAGGYRLMASQVLNDKSTVDGYDWQYKEAKGYVAFDLFVKNFSGTEYYTENNTANEEAIYLTTDSVVKVANDGVADTGIENSVRVAFAQIGRVTAKTTDPSVITGITCETKDTVTGICRTAQIWEPNQDKHTQAAIDHYLESCKTRKADGEDVLDKASYETTSCQTFATTDTLPTYVIAKPITETSAVDVYDGTRYNTYTNTVGDTKSLKEVTTFTDNDKMQGGNLRPEFISLAPNSITKVRVYVYIEGQDIDNNDLASIGKKISVAFGLTKDRFDYIEGDDYAQDVVDGDTTAPVITVAGTTEEEGVTTLSITKNSAFDPRAIVTATDAEEGDITARVDIVNNTVKIDTAGNYLLSYVVSDWAGNYTQKDVTVTVTD